VSVSNVEFYVTAKHSHAGTKKLNTVTPQQSLFANLSLNELTGVIYEAGDHTGLKRLENWRANRHLIKLTFFA